jgi:hypothetical protein
MDATLRTAAWPKVGATLERAQQSPVRDAAAPSVRFYVAGRVAVEGSSTLDQGDLPGAQGRRILVHLVLARHRPVPAEELVGTELASLIHPEDLGCVVHEVRRFLAASREELEAVTNELAAALGLGGRDRRPGSTAERARVNATRAIRSSSLAVCSVGLFSIPIRARTSSALSFITFARGSKFL